MHTTSTTPLAKWFFLVQTYVSATAFIDDGRVYIRELNIQEIELHDPVVVLRLMNENPHLLQNVFKAWECGEDDIAATFCDILYVASYEALADAFLNDSHVVAVQAAASVIELLFGVNPVFIQRGEPLRHQVPQAPVTPESAVAPSVFQHAVFTR